MLLLTLADLFQFFFSKTLSAVGIISVKQKDSFASQKSKKDGKDRETIQSSTTPDPGYHMGK